MGIKQTVIMILQFISITFPLKNENKCSTDCLLFFQLESFQGCLTFFEALHCSMRAIIMIDIQVDKTHGFTFQFDLRSLLILLP